MNSNLPNIAVVQLFVRSSGFWLQNQWLQLVQFRVAAKKAPAKNAVMNCISNVRFMGR